MSKRAPRVVAELGRPETPEETAARKAENSRNYRRRKTVNNLVLSLLATAALVLLIVFAVPRGEIQERPAVDWSSVAAEAQASRDEPLADPELPDSFSSNYAEVRGGQDGVQSWNIGFLTPSDQFIGLTQAFAANDTWLARELKNTAADRTMQIDGIEWTVYDNRDMDDAGNVAYALVTEAGPSTFIIFGTGSDAEFSLIAEAIAPQVAANESLGAEDQSSTDSEDQ